MARRLGQCIEVEPGKKYICKVHIKDKKYKSRTFHGTKRQAEAHLAKMQAQREEFSPHALARKQLAFYAELYLKNQAGRVRANTLRKETSHVNSRIIPALGKIKLEKLQARHIERWLNQLNAELHPESVRNLYKTLNAILNRAVSEEVLAKNPCPARPNLATRRKAPVKALDHNQLRAVLSHAEGQALAMFTVLVSSGLRPCELRPLVWTDLDLANARISVTKSADTHTDEVSTPKTDLSMRSVVLPPSTLELLENLPRESTYIFHNGFGDMVKHQALANAFKKAARKASIEGFTLYSLRHTHITQLLLSGESVSVVAARVGDKPERILNTYSHVIQGVDVALAGRWDTLMSSRVIN